MSGHTPGPWVKVRGELVGSNGKKVVEYSSGIAIMCGGGDNPEHTANARLRNAAPDLLEALIEFRSAMSANIPIGDKYAEWLSSARSARDKADAAIAKATGDE